jgi:hypothetical protein
MESRSYIFALAVQKSCVQNHKNLVLDTMYVIQYTPRSFGRPTCLFNPRRI